MHPCDGGELLTLEVVVQVTLILGLGEITAGPLWESRRAGRIPGGIGFSGFQAGLQWT